MIVTLTPAEADATTEKIAKINTRAAKRGFTGHLDVVIGPAFARKVTAPSGLTFKRMFHEVEITGVTPKYNGWEFVAAVDTVGDGFVLRFAPGAPEGVVDRAALTPGGCDHCGVAKGNRKYTYAVRNVGTGEVKQVGSTCVKDFTGWDGKPVFYSVQDVADIIDEGGAGGHTGAAEAPVAEVVAFALAATEAAGWVSRGNAEAYGKTATAEIVSDAMWGVGRSADDAAALIRPHLAEARAKAPEVIAAVTAGLAGETSEYAVNLRTVLAAEWVGERHLALAASTVAAHHRLVADKVKRDAEAAAAADVDYLGEVGAKVTFTGAVAVAMTVDGYTYNSTQRFVVVEGPGFAAKMYTTAGWAYEVEAGDEVTLTATVKAHAEYRGAKQTVVTRAKRA